MTSWRTLLAAAVINCSLVAAGCGQNASQQVSPAIDVPSADGMVVKARASFVVATDNAATTPSIAALMSGAQPVSVVNAVSTTMTLDNGQWNVPVIANDLLDFGTLAITTLLDNDLKKCGANGKQHCGTALIRVYTTGQAGSGLWNAEGQYGAPITVSLEGATPLPVGLEAAGAAVTHSVSLPKNKNVLRLSDFVPAPRFGFRIDFTNAGAGSYATTIVVEYALAP